MEQAWQRTPSSSEPTIDPVAQEQARRWRFGAWTLIGFEMGVSSWLGLLTFAAGIVVAILAGVMLTLAVTAVGKLLFGRLVDAERPRSSLRRLQGWASGLLVATLIAFALLMAVRFAPASVAASAFPVIVSVLGLLLPLSAAVALLTYDLLVFPNRLARDYLVHAAFEEQLSDLEVELHGVLGSVSEPPMLPEGQKAGLSGGAVLALWLVLMPLLALPIGCDGAGAEIPAPAQARGEVRPELHLWFDVSGSLDRPSFAVLQRSLMSLDDEAEAAGVGRMALFPFSVAKDVIAAPAVSVELPAPPANVSCDALPVTSPLQAIRDEQVATCEARAARSTAAYQAALSVALEPLRTAIAGLDPTHEAPQTCLWQAIARGLRQPARTLSVYVTDGQHASCGQDSPVEVTPGGGRVLVVLVPPQQAGSDVLGQMIARQEALEAAGAAVVWSGELGPDATWLLPWLSGGA